MTTVFERSDNSEVESTFMTNCDDVRSALREHGLLLLQDKVLPSVVGILTGESLSGSWWSHPRGGTIFACLEALDRDRDVLITYLVGGKVTFVDRRLRPAFLAVATSGEPWQTAGLSAEGRRLVAAVRREGSRRAKGPIVRELRTRLLVETREVHTESGRHEIRLAPWPASPPRESARRELEDALTRIGGNLRLLPWNRLPRAKSRI